MEWDDDDKEARQKEKKAMPFFSLYFSPSVLAFFRPHQPCRDDSSAWEA